MMILLFEQEPNGPEPTETLWSWSGYAVPRVGEEVLIANRVFVVTRVRWAPPSSVDVWIEDFAKRRASDTEYVESLAQDEGGGR